jgi:hypothetical protein
MLSLIDFEMCGVSVCAFHRLCSPVPTQLLNQDAFDLNERLYNGGHWAPLEPDRQFHLRITEPRWGVWRPSRCDVVRGATIQIIKKCVFLK